MKLIKARYTIGPETLDIGKVSFVRDKWNEKVPAELEKQLLLPVREKEYGFEVGKTKSKSED